MKRSLVAAAGVLAAVVTFLPAAPAQASSLCVPITIDGNPVCQDTSVADPILAAVDTAVFTIGGIAAPYVSAVEDEVSASQDCGGVNYSRSDPATLLVEVDFSLAVWSGTDCRGVEVHAWAQPVAVGPGTDVVVHVPQVCYTGNNTCVGGVDQPVTQTPLSVYLTQRPDAACLRLIDTTSWICAPEV